MFGLNGEQVVHRCRARAAERARELDLPRDADDAQLVAASQQVLAALDRDRKLRRPLREPTVRAIAEALATWEVVLAAVGPEEAEARYHVLRGLEPPEATPEEATPPEEPAWHRPPDGPAEPPHRIRRRKRRMADPDLTAEQVAGGLRAAVTAEPTPADDPTREDGFDHSLWLEEWLELAIGGVAFRALEATVAAHPDVTGVLHQDREVLYVAAPGLHPDDVRALVIGIVAPHFDPAWEAKLDPGPSG